MAVFVSTLDELRELEFVRLQVSLCDDARHNSVGVQREAKVCSIGVGKLLGCAVDNQVAYAATLQAKERRHMSHLCVMLSCPALTTG